MEREEGGEGRRGGWGESESHQDRKTGENSKTATERQNERESTHAIETQSSRARYRET